MITQIHIEDCAAEVRAAALDADGRSYALFTQPKAPLTDIARWGDVLGGHLRKRTKSQGGGYAELNTGEEVFLRTPDIGDHAEGARVNLKVVSEARRGKLARAVISSETPLTGDFLSRWITSLPGGARLAPETVKVGDAGIEAAFTEALLPNVTLPGGGLIRLTQTPALTAIDIDTAGRNDKGRAYDRALAINTEAAGEAARHLSLRGIGGLAVLDCTAPLRKETGTKIKQAFLTTWRAINTAKAEALAPSPFGLMEAALAWRWRPIADALLDETGHFTPQAALLKTLRGVECEAIANPTARYAVDLPKRWPQAPISALPTLERELQARYGARISLIAAACDTPGVRPL